MSDANPRSLYDEPHVFGMEWAAGEQLTYTLDHRPLHTFRHGDPAQGETQCVDISINGNPFYFILWNLLSDYSWAPEAAPTGNGHRPDSVYIDWIRQYAPCADGDPDPACVESTISAACPNPCDGFGRFELIHSSVTGERKLSNWLEELRQ